MTGNGAVFKELQTRLVSIGEIGWDRTTRQASLRGEPVKLTWRTAAAFSLLVEARGGVVTREEFERQVWGDAQMDYSVVSQCIKTLRRALDPAPGGASYIETVARAGYRLAVEVVEEPEAVSAEPVAPAPVAPRRGRPLWPWLALALGVVLAVLAGLFVYQSAHKRQDRKSTRLNSSH